MSKWIISLACVEQNKIMSMHANESDVPFVLKTLATLVEDAGSVMGASKLIEEVLVEAFSKDIELINDGVHYKKPDSDNRE